MGFVAPEYSRLLISLLLVFIHLGAEYTLITCGNLDLPHFMIVIGTSFFAGIRDLEHLNRCVNSK
jgi:hypothetical protein